MTVEELVSLVQEEFGFVEMLEEGADESKVGGFVFAVTSLTCYVEYTEGMTKDERGEERACVP
eukprot:12020016-Ditylum_brightwellii.AAC.1